MNDPINTFNRLLEACVIPQVGTGKFGIQVADIAVIARLARHQPGVVTAGGKLVGCLLADKTGNSGDQ
jgi:hypothetical protein